MLITFLKVNLYFRFSSFEPCCGQESLPTNHFKHAASETLETTPNQNRSACVYLPSLLHIHKNLAFAKFPSPRLLDNAEGEGEEEREKDSQSAQKLIPAVILRSEGEAKPR